ncbi:MAG: AI-2E family transporter [Bryobacteraceae bacterium]|jgi:predicted PurR-regulated permease PerM
MTAQLRPRSSSGIRNLAIVCAVVGILYVAREILIPLAFAIVLSMILAPAVGLLQKLRIGRVPSALFVFVVASCSAGAIGWVIVNDFVDVAIGLPRYRQNIDRKLQAFNAPGTSALGRAADSVKELSNQLSTVKPVPPPSDLPSPSATKPPVGLRAVNRPMPVQVVQAPANDLDYAGDLLKPMIRPLAISGMVLIFTLYLLIEQHDLRNRIFRLAGMGQLNLMTQALDDATKRVSRYLILQLLVNLVFGVVWGTGLYLIGVPYAALWGAIAAILRLVPYVGSLVAAALPLILSLAVFDGWRSPLMVGVLYGALELTTGNFVEPWLYGTHTGISSLALLLTTVFWSALWGPAGLILSTPLTVCVVVLGRYVPQFSFLHVLLGDEAPLAAEAQVYQRLLAMDDPEARAVMDRYLKDHSLAQLYDSVLIPALTLAEQDRHKGALDPAREEFLFLSIKEMLADLPDSSSDSGAEKVEASEETKRVWPAGRVICIPARDEADEISAAMLSQLLELGGCNNVSFPLDSDLLHLMESLQLSQDDVICISALPPFALSHAKTVCRQLRTHFPRTRIILGVWGFAGDTQRALERFQAPRPDCLVTTLEQAISAVLEPVAVETA